MSNYRGLETERLIGLKVVQVITPDRVYAWTSLDPSEISPLMREHNNGNINVISSIFDKIRLQLAPLLIGGFVKYLKICHS